jgi:hypothetical protein
MSLTTPILASITSFDAESSYDFIFSSIGGSQVTKNNLVIELNSDGTEVYNQTVDSFAFKHTVSSGLTNNIQYKAKIRTGDSTSWSVFSSYIVFT